jgi:hypothetical protein
MKPNLLSSKIQAGKSTPRYGGTEIFGFTQTGIGTIIEAAFSVWLVSGIGSA